MIKILANRTLRLESRNSSMEGVKKAIKNGAQINKRFKEGTALMIAIENRNIELTEFLLKKNADVNVLHKGCSALIISIRTGQKSIARKLLKNGADPNISPLLTTPLIEAIIKNDIGLVNLLIDRGADVNKQTVKGLHSSPLMIAFGFRYKKIIECLLIAGATPKAKLFSMEIDLYQQALDSGQRQLAQLILKYYKS